MRLGREMCEEVRYTSMSSTKSSLMVNSSNFKTPNIRVMMNLRGSSVNIKSMDNSGQPWRVPLQIEDS